MRINRKTIYFAKDREDVIIPTKRDEDAGYDIYANFEEDYIAIKPHETKIIPTGLRSAFDKKWFVQLNERGSTGTKGIAQRCGVIDSGYRGEWMIPITNTTNKTLLITKEFIPSKRKDVIIYPYDKAICQAILLEVPKVKCKEVTKEQLMEISSERGIGKIGSSGK
jgi:dUTP pyrophosphatase